MFFTAKFFKIVLQILPQKLAKSSNPTKFSPCFQLLCSNIVLWITFNLFIYVYALYNTWYPLYWVNSFVLKAAVRLQHHYKEIWNKSKLKWQECEFCMNSNKNRLLNKFWIRNHVLYIQIHTFKFTHFVWKTLFASWISS